MSTLKEKRVEARCTEANQTKLKMAADLQGCTLSEFLITAGLKSAEKVISNHLIIEASVADQIRFAEALLNPPPIAPALKRAFENHKRLIK